MFNTMKQHVTATSLEALDILEASTELRDRLEKNTKAFRAAMMQHGFEIPPGEHPIVPIMLGDAALARRMASALLDEGIYVIGFNYPVVPKGKARIRVQISAAHTTDDIEHAAAAFARVRRSCQA